MPNSSTPNTADGQPAGPMSVPVQAGQVAAAANRIAATLPRGEVVLDFAGVQFVGSEELGALVALNRKVRGAGGKLRLVNVGPPIAGVFAITRLDTILDVHRVGSAA